MTMKLQKKYELHIIAVLCITRFKNYSSSKLLNKNLHMSGAILYYLHPKALVIIAIPILFLRSNKKPISVQWKITSLVRKYYRGIQQICGSETQSTIIRMTVWHLEAFIFSLVGQKQKLFFCLSFICQFPVNCHSLLSFLCFLLLFLSVFQAVSTLCHQAFIGAKVS